jgi:hypothetical protein
MRTRPFLLSALTLCLLIVSAAALAQEVTHAASAGYVNLAVKLGRAADSKKPALEEIFSTSDPYKHSVYCISSYYDVRYMLRDSLGRVVPTNKAQWGSEVGPYFSAQGGPGAPDACRTVIASKAVRDVELADIYPALRPGMYTLRVTLAPRNSGERAALSPFAIIIR